MADPNRPDATDAMDTGDTTARDPDRHSTWNTIDGTVGVDECSTKTISRISSSNRYLIRSILTRRPVAE